MLQILNDVYTDYSEHYQLKHRAYEDEGGNELANLKECANDLVCYKFTRCQAEHKFKTEAGDVGKDHLVSDSHKK